MSFYKLRKGGAYGRAIGMLVSGPQFAKGRYWKTTSSKSSFKFSSFGAQRVKGVKGRLKSDNRGKQKTKVKGGYVFEDFGYWPQLVDNLDRLMRDANAVQVGLFSGTSGGDVVDRGIRNELGDGNVPQRSFIGSTFDMHRKDIEERFDDAKIPLLLGYLKPKKFLESEGAKLRDNILGFIYGNYWASKLPNAPMTIAKKGFNKPLVETGEMADSIEFKLVRE